MEEDVFYLNKNFNFGFLENSFFFLEEIFHLRGIIFWGGGVAPKKSPDSPEFDSRPLHPVAFLLLSSCGQRLVSLRTVETGGFGIGNSRQDLEYGIQKFR